MRKLIEEQFAGRKLPLVMAHRGGSAQGKENALSTVRNALAIYPEAMIELDVRKSRDGVLYCYHGAEPFGVIAATFFGLFSFSFIERISGKHSTLKSMFDAIPDSVIFYLDLKDTSITADDLRPLVSGRRNIWIAPFWGVAQLKALREGLGDGFAYSLNHMAFFPRHTARALRGYADLIQLWRWNWNQKTVSEIENEGIICHLVHWFVSEEKARELSRLSKYQGEFIVCEDMKKELALEQLEAVPI
ncbi:MAG: hypothetical protein JO026_03825 [Patescibacteria group bacterium]|nr:hypothetical protein [Patescibacteria group bacterium]